MSSTPPSTINKGDYLPPSTNDLRSPCPILNAFANHGLIARDGRGIHAADIRAAMASIGISRTIQIPLTYGSYLENHSRPRTGWLEFLKAPIAYFIRHFGMRPPGQQDTHGVPDLDLNQLALHGAVEHDVSLTRRDFGQPRSADYAQPQHSVKQPDLVAALLDAASDGDSLSTADWARFRLRRLADQERDHPTLNFGSAVQRLAYTEVALIQTLFGSKEKGLAVPVVYAKALFGEERFPFAEGWKERVAGFLGWRELRGQVEVLTKEIEGLKCSEGR